MDDPDSQYDVFISHASEDKADVVFPLADLLRSVGVKVWYDGFELEVGDSLSRSIDRGLVHSRYGVVLISPHFLSKDWTEYELRGLVTKELGKDKVILPIWHNVTKEDVARYSPTLADKFALNTKGEAITSLGRSLVKVIRPDIHQAFQRYLLRRAAQLNQLEKIPLSQIHQGSVRHPTLPQALMARIIVIHALTERWVPISLKESIDTFRRDANPESEIRVWERISACCYLTFEQYKFSDEQMRDIFSIYLFASLGPMDEDDKKSIKHFNSQQVDEFLALFDSNLSHIEINGTEQGVAPNA